MKKLFLSLAAVLLIVSCAKKEDAPSAVKEAASGDYIAKVGDMLITKADVEAMPDNFKLMYAGEDGLDRLIAERMLYQEALKLGLDKDAEYLKSVEYFKKKALAEAVLERVVAAKAKVTDKEVLDYYNKNKKEFTDPSTGKVIELDGIKENLRRVLLMDKQKNIFDKYMEDLRKKYKVEIKDGGAGN